MLCCMLLYVHSSIVIILMGKRELVVLLNLSSWCLVMVEWLFLAVLWGCLCLVIVVFPDHTHFLFPFFISSTIPFPNSRLVGGLFSFYSNLNWIICQQTGETLIWVSIVNMRPLKDLNIHTVKVVPLTHLFITLSWRCVRQITRLVIRLDYFIS